MDMIVITFVYTISIVKIQSLIINLDLESFYFSLAMQLCAGIASWIYSFNQFVSITEVQLKLTQLNKDN